MNRILTALCALAFAAMPALNAQNAQSHFKRGFSENALAYPADLKVLAKSCSWYYDWGPDPAPQVADLVGSDKVIEFVPMAWNGGFDEARLAAYYDAHPNDRYLLGFNEPNFKEQANMTPEQAVEPWHRLEQFAKDRNLILVAPALNYSAWAEYSTPDKWMDQFIAAYKKAYGTEPAFQYLALHCYMNVPSAMIGYVENFAKKYGKQVWLTEFCSWEQSPKVTAETQQQTMITKLELLEKSPYVFRYAWFKARNSDTYPFYNLVKFPGKDKVAGKLTDLGFAYLHVPTFDEERAYKPDEVVPANGYSAQTSLYSIHKSTDRFATDSVEIWLQEVGPSVTYTFSVPEEGDYTLLMRYSLEASGATSRIDVLTNGDETPQISDYTLPETGGTDTYAATTALKLHLTEGTNTVTLRKANFKQLRISYLKLVKEVNPDDPALVTTAIHTVTADDAAVKGVTAYNLCGVKVAAADSYAELHLPAGLYILRSAAGSRKVAVK